MAQHALTLADKQARRDTILEAAANLFASGDGSLPAAAEIAAAAGLAKGTVYLYFRTKEEIFLALLIKYVNDTLASIEENLDQLTGTREYKVRVFLEVYTKHLRQKPTLLSLDAMSHNVLEKNSDAVKLHEHKIAFIQSLQKTARVVENCFELPRGRGLTLLDRTFALTRGLWQSYPKMICPVITDCNADFDRRSFDEELIEALTEYWRGALDTSRQK